MVELFGDSESPSLLIVDDDPVAIRVLRRALPDYSDVRFATNGRDALQLVRARAPALVLLDAEMPGKSGFEVCRLLKADPTLAEIPVIFVTAHDDLEFETKALEMGASDFLSKPVSPPRVRLRVKLHLQLAAQLNALRILSHTDSLTGLANRRAADEAMNREMGRAYRTGRPLSLLMVDIDHFKAYNDSYGHQAGDTCLAEVARALTTVARRPGDLACRVGGEEFAVLLPETGAPGALIVARRLRDTVRAAALPHEASPIAPHVTVSVGVASVQPPPPSESKSYSDAPRPSVEWLVQQADRALYVAKREGRDRCAVAPLTDASDAPPGGRETT